MAHTVSSVTAGIWFTLFTTFEWTMVVMVDIEKKVGFHACQDELMSETFSTFDQSRERRLLLTAESPTKVVVSVIPKSASCSERLWS